MVSFDFLDKASGAAVKLLIVALIFATFDHFVFLEKYRAIITIVGKFALGAFFLVMMVTLVKSIMIKLKGK